jgi:hypothetical protein
MTCVGSSSPIANVTTSEHAATSPLARMYRKMYPERRMLYLPATAGCNAVQHAGST